MMMSNLPVDLVEEILSRVPATTLKRLRSTCKRWNALFKDVRFAKKHFRKAEKESMVLMLKQYRVFPMRVNLNISPPSIEFKGALDLKYDLSSSKQVDIVEVFHCDGLLLCATKDERLVVWNPCLGETRWIQLEADNEKYSSLRHQNNISGSTIFSRFALGYENNKSNRSYKILRCWCYYDSMGNLAVGFEIYEFSSDLWRVLDDVTFHWIVPAYGVSVKGNAYWIAKDELFLLSFDFTEERLKRLCLPPVEKYLDFRAISVVGDEKLSVLKQTDNSRSKMELWVTNIIDTDDIEAVLKWTKSFTVDVPFLRDYFSYDMTFSVDMKKKVVVFCGEISKNPIIIVGEGHNFRESIYESFSSWKYMYNYVPSLVQIQ